MNLKDEQKKIREKFKNDFDSQEKPMTARMYSTAPLYLNMHR